eukprot:COSAG02_NODE_24603_length_683_cov_0.768836_1_plen_201_part_10
MTEAEVVEEDRAERAASVGSNDSEEEARAEQAASVGSNGSEEENLEERGASVGSNGSEDPSDESSGHEDETDASPSRQRSMKAGRAATRARALLVRIEGLIKEQIVLGEIMGAEHVMKTPQIRAKIVDLCKHSVSALDLLELLALKGRPCSAGTRSHFQTTLKARAPHTTKQANAARMAKKQLGLMIADAMDYSKLDKLHR